MAVAGAGTTLSDIYSSAQRTKLELREGLERLEKLESMTAMDSGGSLVLKDDSLGLSPDLTEHMRLQLAELQRVTAEMDRMWRSQVHRQQIWKRKIEVIAEEAEALRQGLDKYLSRENRRQRDVKERAELLGRHAANEGARIYSEFEADQRDVESAKNSAKMLEEALMTGYETLKRMAEQRELLKGAQRKALDVLNYIGLSDTVLKKINRRQWTDRIVSYGGMILVLVVVFTVWRLTH